MLVRLRQPRFQADVVAVAGGLRSPTPQRRPDPGDPMVIVSLDEFGPLNPASPEELAGMIRRYLGRRNPHADDEKLPEIVARAKVA